MGLLVSAVVVCQLAAATLIGLGVGTAMTASFVVMLDRTRGAGASSVASVWNVSVDGGIGLGALALLPLAAVVGYRGSLLGMAAIAMFGAGLCVAHGKDRTPRDDAVDAHGLPGPSQDRVWE